MMQIAVVDYGSGNLASASRALALAAERAGIDATVAVTADPAVVAAADRIVLPGQGAFADCAAGLAAVPGMRDAIETATARGTPFLGICVGMQLMAERGLEHTVTPGLRLDQGRRGGDAGARPAPAADGLERPGFRARLRIRCWTAWHPDDHVYFVHSYALVARRTGRNHRHHRLRRHRSRHRRCRQPRRHPVPRRKKPGGRHPPAVQLPALDTLTMAGRHRSTQEPELLVEHIKRFNDDDLHALCEATDAAIIDGGGFGWVTPPGRRALETYFRGVLLVPERELFVARLNGDIVGSAILVRPPRNNEAQAFAASLMHSYIAPYARGHGLARMLTEAVEERARELGYHILNLDVRETQAVGDRDCTSRMAISAGASIPNTPWCAASRSPASSTTSGCGRAKGRP